MAYPRKIEKRRKQFMPRMAEVFIKRGYLGATSAELARHCNVRENVLYRIWPNKKAMFREAIRYIYDVTIENWQQILSQEDGDRTPARRILNHQAANHGKMRLYRIVFAGLMVDDPEIRADLRDLYREFHRYIVELLREHHQQSECATGLDEQAAAWALIGMGAVVDIQRELGLLEPQERGRLLRQAGDVIIAGPQTPAETEKET